MDVKIITNVGYWDGQSGKGAIYAATTVGGTNLLAIQMIEDGETTWRYLRKSQVESGLSMGDMKVATDLNLSLFTDVLAPEFTTGTSDFREIATVTNGANLPRLIVLENPYTLKGEGVTTAEIDKVKATSGSTGTIGGGADAGSGSGTGSTNLLDGFIPKDFGAFFTNPFKFIQDNPLFFAAVAGAVYFFRRKKKKPLWLI
jgi:hypothetical protein